MRPNLVAQFGRRPNVDDHLGGPYAAPAPLAQRWSSGFLIRRLGGSSPPGRTGSPLTVGPKGRVESALPVRESGPGGSYLRNRPEWAKDVGGVSRLDPLDRRGVGGRCPAGCGRSGRGGRYRRRCGHHRSGSGHQAGLAGGPGQGTAGGLGRGGVIEATATQVRVDPAILPEDGPGSVGGGPSGH